jgi:UDP-N-acetyl-D-mannosaminuronic acid dehydrogenase
VSSTQKICVVGLGYIGLPTASLLGTKGFDVVGVDINPDVVATINSGKIHIVEPELDVLVRSAVNSGKLRASVTPEAADIFIIAVPTPILPDKKPDLRYVDAAAEAILPFVKAGDIVILESTSPIGTTENIVAARLSQRGFNLRDDVAVAHCPERVLPGKILRELVENDRIVGGINEWATEKAAEFYRSFVSGEVLETNARTAELTKLAENSFRDVNIALANEFSIVCERQKINVWELISLANRHPRVNFLNPGPGVGGHCIAVDPYFVISGNEDHTPLLAAARRVNEIKPKWVIDRIVENAERFRNPTIGLLGLAFKADVDDLRESPALEIANELKALARWNLLVCEPNIEKHADFDLTSHQQLIERSDIIVLLVDHKPFIKLKATDFKEKILIDTRGVIR